MTIATATRTDVHRPGSPDFDPEAYRLVDVFDLHPLAKEGRLLEEAIGRLEREGVTQASSRFGCGHCGQTNLRFVALLARDDVNEWIFVGQDCLAGRFLSQTKASFDALRKAAELERQKQAVKGAWLRLCDANPGIAYASYAVDIIDAYVNEAKRGDASDALHIKAGADWALSTLADIAHKARRYGDASEKQVAFVERLLNEVDQKLAAYAEREPEPEVPPAPEGKVVVEGVIVHTEWRESAYGGSLKMIVKADEGWKVWSTLPASLTGADKGDRVRFTATLTRSDRDQGFAFASRPTKGLVLALAENE